jgi:16S rRNA (guanine527-N7)-methyltransferase
MTPEEAAAALGLRLDPAQLQKLERHLDLVMAWNVRVDLVAPGPREELAERHLLDSLLLLVMADPPYGSSVADVGSGAGFPGLVWAIARPDLRLTLLEPRQKRAAVLERAVLELGLTGAEVVARTAEEAARMPEHHHRYDLVVARAVAPPLSVRKLAQGLVRPGGRIFVPLAPEAEPPDGAQVVERAVPWAPGRVRRAAVFLGK